MLDTLDTMRGVRRDRGERVTGRLTSQEEDLLRAAIVFTGAGLDATLKRLIRDTLPRLLETNVQAQKKFEAFAAQRLGASELADTRMVARYLVAANPREALIDDYVYDLTGSSLQSAEQVQSTAGALGIDDAELRQRVNSLGALFTARNQVSHELDLQRRSGLRTYASVSSHGRHRHALRRRLRGGPTDRQWGGPPARRVAPPTGRRPADDPAPELVGWDVEGMLQVTRTCAGRWLVSPKKTGLGGVAQLLSPRSRATPRRAKGHR